MFRLDILAATRTLEKTMPFILYRLLLCLGVGLTFLLATLIGAGTIIAFSALAKNSSALAGVGASLGFLACGYAAYHFRAVWFRVLTASHLALLADHVRQHAVPVGKAQIGHAGRRVSACFPSAAELNRLDQAVKRCLMETVNLYPPLRVTHPGLQKAINLLAGRLFAAHHQTVLAWHFYTDSQNAWHSARVALTCLAEQRQAVWRNRLIMTLFEWGGWAAAYWLMLYPTGLVAESLPVAIGLWQYVFAFVFASALKVAFLEPLSETAIMEGMLPRIQAVPAQDAALTEHSEAFRLIREREQE
jgi:hypothetical protein